MSESERGASVSQPARPACLGRHPVRAGLMHSLRVGLLALILLLMHWQHARVLSSQRAAGLADVSLDQIRTLFPQATTLGAATSRGGREVLADDQILGEVLQTFPEGTAYLGFSGPTNTLIGFDSQGRVVGLSILSSRDTRDHVGLIRNDRRFLQAFNGKNETQAANTRVDAVTGATLTSLAILQGVQARLGRQPGSLKFPNAYTLADAKRFFPSAVTLTRDTQAPELWLVTGEHHTHLGWLLSNSPAADETVGYQGPTRALLGLRTDGKILGLVVGESFDNEPYVGYVRDDTWFAEAFNDKPLEEWAKTRWEEAGIEGVSGATMTSQTVAEGLLAAAHKIAELRAQQTREQAHLQIVRWRVASTITLLAAGLVIGLTRLRRWTWLRRIFQITLIVIMGFINGDLLSMAMVVGWAQSGIPWKNALGLVCLAGAALTVPVVFRQNVYCDHLCPHGALQQLLPRRWQLQRKPRMLIYLLRAIRPLLLLIIVLGPLLQWRISLVDLEPFDAYAWRAAGISTMSIAVGGLIASLFIPMGYCQYGCPTGAVLGYLRRHTRSDRLSSADALAFGFLTLACLCFLR